MTYYVNAVPSEPLVITVRDKAGAPVNLAAASSVVFVGDALPAGTASINNAAQGKVQYLFSSPFASAGLYVIQVRVNYASGGPDISGPVTLRVENLSEPAALLLTPSQVEDLTGVPVSRNQVARAQALIGLVVGQDLNDPDWYPSEPTRDVYWLKSAVAWQATATPVTPTQPGAGDYDIPAGARSVSTGDLSISFGDDGYTAGAGGVNELHGNARLALNRLSWLGNFQVIRTHSMFEDWVA